MFSKLPDLFDRNFATAYFLPFALFTVSSIALWNHFSLFPHLIQIDVANQIEVLIGTSLIGLLSWFGGILLMVANRDIIRFMEGYGKLNPLRLFLNVQKRRFRKLRSKIVELDDEYLLYLRDNKQPPVELIAKRNELMQDAVYSGPLCQDQKSTKIRTQVT